MTLSHYRKFELGKHATRTKSAKSKRKSTVGKKVQTVTLKTGVLLFHGHPEVKEWTIPHNRPAFFGGTLVALYYAEDQAEYVSTYVLVKNARLLDLGSKVNFGKFYSTLNESDKFIFSRVTGYGLTNLKTDSCGYRNKSRTAIKFCTEDYIEPEDEDTDTYAMLKFAKMICANGYDGYYIPPIHERAYEKREKNNLLTEQIILCKPLDHVMKVNQLSVASIASNMKKRKSRSKKR